MRFCMFTKINMRKKKIYVKPPELHCKKIKCQNLAINFFQCINGIFLILRKLQVARVNVTSGTFDSPFREEKKSAKSPKRC